MKSKASIGDHPTHPMLILLPAGAFVIVLLCDLVYLFGGGAAWWEATRPVLLIGVAGGLVAAIPGFVDLFAIAPQHGAWKIGLWHGGLNLLAVALFAWNAVWRWDLATPPAEGAHFGFWLTVVGATAVAVSGWLGGTMVYRHGVGVVEGAGAARAAAGTGAGRGGPPPERGGPERRRATGEG